jgi:hypothetical protein
VKEIVLEKLAIQPSLWEVVVFQEGKSPEHLQAAAYLRVLCFYTYLEGCSEEALKVQALSAFSSLLFFFVISFCLLDFAVRESELRSQQWAQQWRR